MSVEPVRWPDLGDAGRRRPGRAALALKQLGHAVVVEERQVAGQRLDLHLGAQRERAGAERAVHLARRRRGSPRRVLPRT